MPLPLPPEDNRPENRQLCVSSAQTCPLLFKAARIPGIDRLRVYVVKENHAKLIPIALELTVSVSVLPIRRSVLVTIHQLPTHLGSVVLLFVFPFTALLGGESLLHGSSLQSCVQNFSHAVP